MRACLALAAALALGAAPLRAGDEIGWKSSLKEAVEEGKKSGKLVMVDFYTTWCGPCKMLDKQTYSDSTVVEFADKNLVSLKLDAEDEKGDGLKAARKYGVRAYPTIAFLDGDGKVFAKVIGFSPAEPFLKKVEDIVAAYKDYPELKVQVAKDPKDVAAAARLAAIETTRGELAAALKLLVQAEKVDAAAPALAKAYNAIGDAHQEAEEFDDAIALFQKAAKVGKSPAEVGYARLSIAACYLSQGNGEKSLAAAEKALADKDLPADLKRDAQALLNAAKQLKAAKNRKQADDDDKN